MLLTALLASCLLPQVPETKPEAAKGRAITVALTAKVPTDGDRLMWSPKAARVELRRDRESLVGTFALGPKGAPDIAVRLEHTAGAAHFDTLLLDADRDGSFAESERLSTTPKEQRGKWWSSFTATVLVPFPAAGQQPARQQPYAMSLWFVEDPREPDAQPVLRWSRNGWHEGKVELDGKTVHVLTTEMEMDGVFTTADCWALAHDRKLLLAASSREMSNHTWLEERAFRVTSVAADGSSITFEPFDPRTTLAEEKARADVYKQDREAKRAPKPLAFGADFAAAMVEAVRDKKRVLVDFATTWCGPCKLMDELVYTAADFVGAATNVIAVKLDGDVERDLVKRFQVEAYPTMLLLEPDGTEVRRLVGYQGVAAMVKFVGK
ncbi:MAG: thioredoxin family protein [Planctomycetota bacterium]